jgi:hypothetical protein
MNSLKTAVYEIVDSDLPNKYGTFETKYPHHFKSHPRLMKMACEPDLCVQTFKSMFESFCAMKEHMDNSDISREAAEKVIGQNLANEYLPV